MKVKLISIIFILLFSLNNLKSEDKNFDVYIRINKNINLEEFKNKLKSDLNLELNESILPYRLSLTSKFQFSQQNFLDEKTKNILSKEEVLLRTYRVEINNFNQKKMALKAFRNYDELEYFEPVRIPKFLDIEDYDDYHVQKQAVLKDMKAFSAWAYAIGDTSIVIGISDSGLEQDHEDISPNLFRFWGEIPNNGIDDDINGYIDDYQGVSLENQRTGSGGGNTSTSVAHGLNVAGIAGAKVKNGIGIVGTGHNCRIFPIKISKGNSANPIYAYESIIYAGINKFDVLNCSWGTIGKASPIEQSIVDFAIANNVVIVASAGNTESSFVVEERVLDWYPAGYNGVISVASMADDEVLYTRSSINPDVDVVVQGERNYTTTTENRYTSNGISGTSFSAPVISGAVGVLKYKFPELSPFQLEQIVRYYGRRVTEFNSDWAEIMPKYFDYLEAVQFDESKILALKKEDFKFYFNENDSILNFKKGDEFNLKVKVLNLFNNLNNVKFTLSIAKEFVPGYLEITEDEVTVESIVKDEPIEVKGFKLKLNEDSYQRIVLKLEYQVSGKREFFLIPFDNSPGITNFENDITLLSLSNDGKIGFNNDEQEQGFGFNDKVNGNPILYSGFIGFADETTFSATSGDGQNNSDFTLIENFSNSYNEALYEVNNLPIQFSNKVILNNDEDYRWTKFEVELSSESEIDDFAFGIVGDYDLGIYGNSYLNNRTQYFANGIFNESNIKAETQIAFNEDEKLYFGITSFSKEEDAVIQSAGLTSDESYYISPSSIKSALSSGNELQVPVTSDIGFVSGVRFINGINSSESKKCSFCLSMASNLSDLETYLRNCVLGKTTNVENELDFKETAFIHNGFINFNFNSNELFNVVLVDLHGKIIYSENNINIKDIENKNLQLNNGVYFLNLYNNSNNFNFKILNFN